MNAQHESALVVAVSQRVDVWQDRGERRDALDQQLCAFLVAAGYLPVPVPSCLANPQTGKEARLDPLANWLAALRPRAIVLSGGNDIGDCAERDLTEYALIDHAQQESLPLLGICRGMQMLAVWAGSSLHKLEGHVRTRHTLSAPGEAWPGEVNSYHGYAISACPADFAVTARTQDGSIEAIRHTRLPWEGWMWHPERESPFATSDLARLHTLFHD